jgi:hypothetical protein
METKYIVNNLSGQTINGNVTINGNLTITGTTNIRPYQVFTSLLTQNSEGDVILTYGNESIVKGRTYRIADNPDNNDLITFGAPNNNTNTQFISNQDAQLPYTTSLILDYNTGAPLANVLENTIGNIWFTYGTIGVYYINSNSLFTIGKTWNCISSDASNLNYPEESGYKQISQNNDSILFIESVNSSFVNTDGLMGNTSIEIRVYN